MGVGHVPQEPIRAEGPGADVQGRQRRGAPPSSELWPRDRRRQRGPGALGRRPRRAWYEHHGYAVLDRNWRVPRRARSISSLGAAAASSCSARSRPGRRIATGCLPRRSVAQAAAPAPPWCDLAGDPSARAGVDGALRRRRRARHTHRGDRGRVLIRFR